MHSSISCTEADTYRAFGDRSPPSQDAKSKWIFTTDEGKRGGKTLHLKKIVDAAVEKADCVEKVLMFTSTGAKVLLTWILEVVQYNTIQYNTRSST